MNKNSKYLNGLVAMLVVVLLTPILIKVVTNVYIVLDLILVENLNQLLEMSKSSLFNYELLFKLTLAFSDFNFDFKKVLNALSLFDVLPILSMILLAEINRITIKQKTLYNALFTLALVYLLKYFGFIAIIILILLQGLNVIVGLKYVAIWLSFIITAFIGGSVYLLWAYYCFVQNKGC